MRLNHPKRLFTGLGVSAAVGLSAVAGLLGLGDAVAQAPPSAPTAVNRPAAPPLKAEERDAPGLALTFYPAGAEGKPEAGVDTRASRLAALYVPAGRPASPFVAPGPFAAVFEGNLNLRLRDTFTFSAEGRGDVTVTANDKVVLKLAGDDLATAGKGEPIRLNKGKNKIAIRYRSPAAGDAAFRLLWTVKDENYPEPVPPTALSHNAGAEPVAKGMRLREGRQLLADLRCAKCHTTPAAVEQAAVPGDHPSSHPLRHMPELRADAPDLTAAGARLNKDWLTVWVNNPHALRPGPHMPRVFTPAGGDEAAIDPRSADVAAYLASLGGGSEQPIPPQNEEKIARGGQLFTHLNCIVCHQQPAAQDVAAPPLPGTEGGPAAATGDEAPAPRVPLKYVRAKFKPAALTAFLLNPSAHYAWIPMPNFKFSQEEADAVAAFLLSEANGELPGNLPAGDPAKGKVLVASSGCINCHAVGTDKTAQEKSTLAVASLDAIPRDGWSRGCLAADDAGRKTAPRYELTDAQRQSIVALAATDRASLSGESPAEFAARQVRSLNCIGCHARDGKESLLSTIYDAEQKELEGKYPAPKGEHAESFAPDQRAPLMTWFGEKLRPQWAAAFVGGTIDYKPRPYLHARMPAFATRAPLLAEGLAAEHGVGPAAAAEPPPDAAAAAVGSKLAGKTPNASFSCTQCHAVAKQPPFAPFEAPAVNFAYSAERLRKDYYHRWVHNPVKIDPNTKMPAFEREDGKTTITGAYDGDARKQFEAIWQYLLAGRAIQPPAE